MSINRYLLSLLICLLLSVHCFSQKDSLLEVRGLPTKQIYDLMFDSKGYLWIGHEFGLSRYDGNTFTHFHCPEQNSLAVSNIMEDGNGRIWCRNFTSQVFYIENEKMNLLREYPYKKERRFPEMALVGNKLICTSRSGLFVLNVDNFQAGFVSCGDSLITSFSVINNKVIAYGALKWYYYDPASNEKKAVPIAINSERKIVDDIVLQPYTLNDTMYSFSSRTSRISKVLFRNNQVELAGIIPDIGFMNTINPSGQELWLHTTLQSSLLGGNEIIKGHNLSDLVMDKQGNTWLSSLDDGLFVKYKSYWQKVRLGFISSGEMLQRVEKSATFNLYATDKPAVYVEDNKSGKIVKKISIPPSSGLVQYIGILDSEYALISTTLHIYILKFADMSLEDVLENYYFISVKSAAKTGNSIFMASASGFFELVHKPDTFGNRYSAIEYSKMRSRWVSFDPGTKKLLVAFKDGLSELEGRQFKDILFQGHELPVITMLQAGTRTYISTFNSEILVFKNGALKKITSSNVNRFSPVYKMLNVHDTVWLLGSSYLGIIGPTRDSIRNIVVPSFPNATIYDLAMIDNCISLVTNKGIYSLYTGLQNGNYQLSNYLQKIIINGKDSVAEDGIRLAHNNSSIEFFLSAPFYINPQNIYFKYRLKEAGESEWRNGDFGQSRFLFSSLAPGNYTFEAVAIHNQFGEAEKPISFSFTIKNVWYESNAFKIFFSLLIASAIVLPLTMFFRYRLRHQRIAYEKQLAIQRERERISEEIHDDIGAGLSGLRLYTEMAANKQDNPEVKGSMNRIFNSISELSAKMQDVIWSLNSRNDSLETLLRYIQKQAFKLFSNANIKVVVEIPPAVPQVQIMSEIRTDIYLVVKEALHNTLKHSGADLVTVDFDIRPGLLLIKVADNGKGYAHPVQPGNGLLNMKKRVERLGGKMKTSSHNGVTILFTIPLK